MKELNIFPIRQCNKWKRCHLRRDRIGLGIAATTARLIIDEMAKAVKLKMTTIQKQLFELFTSTLNSGFRTRERDTSTTSKLFLGKALIIGQIKSFAIRSRKGEQHSH